MEQLKGRAYEQRICEIEHGSCTPLIFAATGGTGKAADVMYRQLTWSGSTATSQHTEQRICEIEHGSCTPLIFEATGGTGKAADVMYRQLAWSGSTATSQHSG